jgi:hypothetical protein
MNGCECQRLTQDELKALVCSDQSEGREQAVGLLVRLLTSSDERERLRGYELFRESLSEVLFCSCLNYGSLAGGFTGPLLDIVTRTVELWAASANRTQASAAPDNMSA